MKYLRWWRLYKVNKNDTATLNAECNLSLPPREAWLPAAFIIDSSIKAVCCLIALQEQFSLILQLQRWNFGLKLHFHWEAGVRGSMLGRRVTAELVPGAWLWSLPSVLLRSLDLVCMDPVLERTVGFSHIMGHLMTETAWMSKPSAPGPQPSLVSVPTGRIFLSMGKVDPSWEPCLPGRT